MRIGLPCRIESTDKQGDLESFLKQGDSPSDTALDRRDLAAYASVASLLLNMDEMVTKQ